jgi:hypothetical protein
MQRTIQYLQPQEKAVVHVFLVRNTHTSAIIFSMANTYRKRRHILVTIIVLALVAMPYRIVFFPFLGIEHQSADAAWYTTGGTWTYRKTITIDHTKVDGSADHTSFPVLISLIADTNIDEAQSDGDDILFTSSNGTTKLDHEIELYTERVGSGTLVAWVEVPTLDYNDNTVLYVYYGNASCSSQQNATGVWDADYQGVWHINQEGTSAGASIYTDSTSFANTGNDYIGATGRGGKIGYGKDFDGSTDYITTAAVTNLVNSTETATFSAWVKTATTPNIYDTILLGRSSGISLALIISGQAGTKNEVTYMWEGWSTEYNWDTNLALTTGTWHYVVMRVDTVSPNDIGMIYRDTSSQTRNPASITAKSFDHTWLIGHDTTYSGRDWNGAIDEVRISKSYRSADWITTEYNNQNSPSTFYTLGSQEGGATTKRHFFWFMGF